MSKFKIILTLFGALSAGCGKHVVAMEHANNTASHSQHIKCPDLTSTDVNNALKNGGFHHHINAGQTVMLEKDKHKYTLKITSAMATDLDAASKVTMAGMLSESTHGICKYEIRNESGGLQGDFELALGMNETNPQHAPHVKIMLLDEHMKKMEAEQADIKHEISKKLHQLHEQGKCPNLTSEDINNALKSGGFHDHISADQTVTLEKDKRKYILKFTSAMGANIDVASKIVMTEMLSELTPGKYTCKYEIRNESGGQQGDFELALEK